MFKQKLSLEVKGAEDRVYTFQCDPQSPPGEIHDALHTMKCVVIKIISDNNEKDSPKKEKCVKECKNEEEK